MNAYPRHPAAGGDAPRRIGAVGAHDTRTAHGRRRRITRALTICPEFIAGLRPRCCAPTRSHVPTERLVRQIVERPGRNCQRGPGLLAVLVADTSEGIAMDFQAIGLHPGGRRAPLVADQLERAGLLRALARRSAARVRDARTAPGTRGVRAADSARADQESRRESMRIVVLAGSGLSIPAGYPCTKKLTETVLDGGGDSAGAMVLGFLGRLAKLVTDYYAYVPDRPVNYEDLAYIVGQLADSLSGAFDTPALG